MHLEEKMRNTTIFACLALLLIFMCGPVQAFAAPLPKVEVETTMGNFVLELDPNKAPKTVSNFLFYVRSGFYTDTIFHRIIDGFMIQGGGFTKEMVQKPTKKPIENEARRDFKNDPYTIAMARTSDPHSATSQFFINVAPNTFLNFKSATNQGYGYAVFGKVIEGQEVIDRMKSVPTGRKGGMGDVPNEPIVILKMTLLQQ